MAVSFGRHPVQATAAAACDGAGLVSFPWILQRDAMYIHFCLFIGGGAKFVIDVRTAYAYVIRVCRSYYTDIQYAHAPSDFQHVGMRIHV